MILTRILEARKTRIDSILRSAHWESLFFITISFLLCKLLVCAARFRFEYKRLESLSLSGRTNSFICVRRILEGEVLRPLKCL